MQACLYSMRRLWIPAFLFCVPDVHSVSGYPVFSTDAVFVFFSLRIVPPLHFQIFEYDHICMVFLCIFYDRACDLLSRLYIQAFCICPFSPWLHRVVFPLELPDPSQRAVYPVFFTGMIDKSSSRDSFVCLHNGTDSIGIDPQIFMVSFLQYLGADVFFPDQFLRRYSISV